VIGGAGDYQPLAASHQRQIIARGRDSLPLLVPPRGVALEPHNRFVVSWLSSLIGCQDEVGRDLLRAALARGWRGHLSPGASSTFESGPELLDLARSLRQESEQMAGPLREPAAILAAETEERFRGAKGQPTLIGGLRGDPEAPMRHYDLSGIADTGLRTHLAALALHMSYLEAVQHKGNTLLVFEIEPALFDYPDLLSDVEAVAAQARIHDVALTLVMPAEPGLGANASKLISQCATKLLLRSPSGFLSPAYLTRPEQKRLVSAAAAS
jgi:hypothetical protein